MYMNMHVYVNVYMYIHIIRQKSQNNLNPVCLIPLCDLPPFNHLPGMNPQQVFKLNIAFYYAVCFLILFLNIPPLPLSLKPPQRLLRYLLAILSVLF